MPWGSSETLVGTKDGVVRAWTIRRMPDGERWDPEAIIEMHGTPARPGILPGIHIPTAINITNTSADITWGNNTCGTNNYTLQYKETSAASWTIGTTILNIANSSSTTTRENET